MIPGWKIGRELGRLGQQLRAIPEAVWEPVANRRHDARVARGLETIEGEIEPKSKILLYLVYQPNGIPDSIFATLRGFVQRGYAPVVVSNAPFSRHEARRLYLSTHLTLIRPNFGYDFGGYRDGLNVIRRRGISPERVMLLNDSVWLMPMHSYVLRLERSEADIAGTIMRVRGEERFLESYVYRLSREAFEHPAFWAYWDGLQLTSNKYKVIRRGERGFSAAMRAAGLSLEGVYDQTQIMRELPGKDDDFLAKALEYAAYVDAPLKREGARLLARRDMPDWRAQVLAHVERTLEKRQAYSSFPFVVERFLGYPFLKKSRDPVATAWRRAFLKGVEAGDMKAPPMTFLNEIRARA